MQPTVHVPNAEFKRVLEKYAAGSKKAFNDSIKSRLRDVIIKSYMRTKVAAKAAIAHRLGAVSQKISISRKTGKIKSGAYKIGRGRSGQESLAFRIVQKRSVDATGKGMPTGAARRAAEKMIGAILRTVGFIRSGWIPALRILNQKIRGGGKGGFDAKEQKGRPKGYLKITESANGIALEAANTTKAAAPIGGQALAQAMAEVQAGMLARMAKDLQPEIDKVNGKVIR